ncbi:MAG: sensor domain-containing diguanylate cyclase [Alphaproteobacteria bacterium]|nr:MAG: sensor domain-containing diguanylate cyclase [Alphaproteobacteria bacterium]
MAGGKSAMIRGFTEAEGSVLFGLLAESASNVLLKADTSGFISEARPALDSIGLEPTGELFAPHVADLAAQGHSQRVRRYWSDATAGIASTDQVEFPLCQPHELDTVERWFALTMRPVLDAEGNVTGSIGILRAIERRRTLEDELLAATLTDPLTGLGNRHAFQSILSRRLAGDAGGAIILFGIDQFRAIILNYGQSKGDEVLWAFAQFLRTIFGEETTLVRLEGERFAAILPGAAAMAALAMASETIDTFSSLVRAGRRDGLRLSVSAGVAEMAGHHDGVLANAELTLTLAQAAGGQRAELHGAASPGWRDRRRA